jgi:hypothetical protein
MKINELLTERVADPRTQRTSLANSMPKILRALKDDCFDALNAMKSGRYIFKGIEGLSETIAITDPKLMERKSANTRNHYTLLMDNLPSWQNYPKRSRSLICSTSKSRAGDFGNLYLVVPFDNASIGVCSDHDLWGGFPYLDESLGISVVADINDMFVEAGISDSSYNDFLDSCLLHKANLLNSKYHGAEDLYELLAPADTKGDIVRILDKLLNPKLNKFSLEDVAGIPAHNEHNSHEVWTDSKAYLIEASSEVYEKIGEVFRLNLP